MRIAIRADGDPHMGTGHLSRCRAIAMELGARGHAARYFTREASGLWLSQHGLPFETLPPCADLRAETDAFVRQAQAWGADAALVDSYALDADSYRRIDAAIYSAVIDDNARIPYTARVLINANLYAPTLDYTDCTVKTKLLGGRYAILREEFQQTPARTFSPVVRQILVTMGGSDPRRYTPIALRALSGLRVEQIVVVMGAYADCLEDTQRAAEDCVSAVTILRTPPNIAAVFSRCDMAISAAGSTSYELCALGIPSILVEQADNQRLIVDYFQGADSLLAVRDHRTVDSTRLAALAGGLLGDVDGRRRMREAALRSVSRDGVRHIVSEGFCQA